MSKVLVKYENGEEISGDVMAFNPAQPAFYLHVEGGKSEKVMVNFASIKAVYFPKKSDDERVIHQEKIDQSIVAGLHGFRLNVEFRDGEMLHGTTHKYSPNDRGFYLVPLNPADRSERIYINALAVKKVISRKLIGNVLVEQKKISSDQLDRALHYQREQREKKIGEILRENNHISREQLEESLQKQQERKKQLGQILVEAGYITEEQLNAALYVQTENRKKRIGQILVELKYISPNDICIALATQFSMPWADLSSLNIPADVALTLPEEVVRRLTVIPVERRKDTLLVASAEPQEPGLKGEIGKYTDLDIELVVAYEGYISIAIKRYFPEPAGTASVA